MPLDEHQVAGALVAAGEQRAEHDGVGAGDERLGDVARVLQAAVGDDRHAGLAGGERRLVDGGDLGHAHAGDDAGGADRAGADADLDGVGAGVDERLRRRERVATLPPMTSTSAKRRVGLEAADHVEHAGALAVGGVDDEDVDARVAERAGALPRVAEEADRRTDAQAALVVLRGVGVLLALVEVLDGDEAAQLARRRRRAAASRSCAGRRSRSPSRGRCPRAR